jgi:hypothetical protein
MEKTKVYFSVWGKKFKCRFCFIEKQITKILTVEQLKKIQSENNYNLIRV